MNKNCVTFLVVPNLNLIVLTEKEFGLKYKMFFFILFFAQELFFVFNRKTENILNVGLRDIYD